MDDMRKNIVMGGRIKYIDVFKGIAILLVIFQHSIGTYEKWGHVSKFILSFHMALFFFISGYANSDKKMTANKIIGKAKKFIFPQIIIGILNVVWYWIICDLLLSKHIQQRWIAYFTTWYLPTLFLVYIVDYIFQDIEEYNEIFLMLILFIGAYSLNGYDGIANKIHLTKVPMAFLLFGFGKRVSKYKDEIYIISKKVSWIVIALSILVCSIISNYNQPVYWFSYQMGNIFLTMLSSIIGCIFILIISVKLENNTILRYCGETSIIIYTIQFIVYRCIGVFIINLDGFFGGLIKAILSCIVSVILSYSIKCIRNRYSKWHITQTMRRNRRM